MAFALTGLALDANWPKLARVLPAALAYGASLLVGLRATGALGRPATAVPFPAFGLAGAAPG